MNNKVHIIKCKLCEIPIGMNFNKPDDNNTYCYVCGETILKFINNFKPETYKFTPWFDLDCNHALKHRFVISNRFYLEHLNKNKFNEIPYTNESKYT